MNDVTLPICESTVLIDPDLVKIFFGQDWADVHLQCRSMMIYTSGFVVSFQFTNMSIIAVLLIHLVVLSTASKRVSDTAIKEFGDIWHRLEYACYSRVLIPIKVEGIMILIEDSRMRNIVTIYSGTLLTS